MVVLTLCQLRYHRFHHINEYSLPGQLQYPYHAFPVGACNVPPPSYSCSYQTQTLPAEAQSYQIKFNELLFNATTPPVPSYNNSIPTFTTMTRPIPELGYAAQRFTFRWHSTTCSANETPFLQQCTGDLVIEQWSVFANDYYHFMSWKKCSKFICFCHCVPKWRWLGAVTVWY